MRKFKMLVLTDHTNHTEENSLYPLVRAFRLHPRCAQIDVATRGDELNHFFFNKHLIKSLFVNKVDESFSFHQEGRAYKKHIRRELLRNYDIVWLRMPPPLSYPFLDFLAKAFPTQLFINAPTGIYKTGSKEFLMNFPELCPPMKVCHSIEDITDFKASFPIVLKPFREFGGKGIVKIEGNQVWEGNRVTTFDTFKRKIESTKIEYLGVKFLKNVLQGDKRIIVINGKIMGASLRLPAQNSWICNVAQGGSSHLTEVAKEEQQIVERINPSLSQLGIVMYGIDTLVNDSGQRVLSEINTTSIGGLPQIAKLKGQQSLLKEAADLVWNYIVEKILEKDAIANT